MTADSSKGEIRIGISGWRYPPWRGEFYPEGLTQKSELHYASRRFRAIEINGTFYSLQRPESFDRWYRETPEDFVFSVKGNRYITHVDRLKDPRQPLANFLASGVLRLGRKLGPFLWQFPPFFKYDSGRLRRFFELLPKTGEEAIRLARGRGSRMKGRTALASPDPLKIRHAIEIRHSSFENEEFIKILREHQVAIVVADTAGKWPLIEDATGDFVYIRLHGDQEIYVSGYTEDAIEHWCRKVTRWNRGGTPRGARLIGQRTRPVENRDVYVFFDNDVKVRAPFDALSLAACTRSSPRKPS